MEATEQSVRSTSYAKGFHVEVVMFLTMEPLPRNFIKSLQIVALVTLMYKDNQP